MSGRPRVLHVSPFLDLAGGNRALITILEEMARRGETFAFVLTEGDLAEECRRVGAVVRTADSGELHKSKLRRWWRRVAALRRAVRELKIDVVHSHSAIGNHYCWPVKIMTGTKLVTHQRDNYKFDYFHFGLGAADQIIAVSNIIKEGLPPRLKKKTTAIHDGVELPNVAPPTRHEGPVRVGIAGRCWPQKGQDLVIDAAAMLADKHAFEVHMWGLSDNEYSNFL